MRRRVSKVLLLPILLVALALAATASAGAPTPLSLAQGKSQAKSAAHELCRDRAATCTGSRVKDCRSVTKYRVDCIGYLLERKSYCSFKIRVVATGDQTVKIDAINVKCGRPYN